MSSQPISNANLSATKYMETTEDTTSHFKIPSSNLPKSPALQCYYCDDEIKYGHKKLEHEGSRKKSEPLISTRKNLQVVDEYYDIRGEGHRCRSSSLQPMPQEFGETHVNRFVSATPSSLALSASADDTKNDKPNSFSHLNDIPSFKIFRNFLGGLRKSSCASNASQTSNLSCLGCDLPTFSTPTTIQKAHSARDICREENSHSNSNAESDSFFSNTTTNNTQKTSTKSEPIATNADKKRRRKSSTGILRSVTNLFSLHSDDKDRKMVSNDDQIPETEKGKFKPITTPYTIPSISVTDNITNDRDTHFANNLKKQEDYYSSINDPVREKNSSHGGPKTCPVVQNLSPPPFHEEATNATRFFGPNSGKSKISEFLKKPRKALLGGTNQTGSGFMKDQLKIMPIQDISRSHNDIYSYLHESTNRINNANLNLQYPRSANASNSDLNHTISGTLGSDIDNTSNNDNLSQDSKFVKAGISYMGHKKRREPIRMLPERAINTETVLLYNVPGNRTPQINRPHGALFNSESKTTTNDDISVSDNSQLPRIDVNFNFGVCLHCLYHDRERYILAMDRVPFVTEIGQKPAYNHNNINNKNFRNKLNLTLTLDNKKKNKNAEFDTSPVIPSEGEESSVYFDAPNQTPKTQQESTFWNRPAEITKQHDNNLVRTKKPKNNLPSINALMSSLTSYSDNAKITKTEKTVASNGKTRYSLPVYPFASLLALSALELSLFGKKDLRSKSLDYSPHTLLERILLLNKQTCRQSSVPTTKNKKRLAKQKLKVTKNRNSSKHKNGGPYNQYGKGKNLFKTTKSRLPKLQDTPEYDGYIEDNESNDDEYKDASNSHNIYNSARPKKFGGHFNDQDLRKHPSFHPTNEREMVQYLNNDQTILATNDNNFYEDAVKPSNKGSYAKTKNTTIYNATEAGRHLVSRKQRNSMVYQNQHTFDGVGNVGAHHTSHTLKNHVDWTYRAHARDHIWTDYPASGDACYLIENSKCKKTGPKKRCSVCKIPLHVDCIETLAQIGFKCRPSFTMQKLVTENNYPLPANNGEFDSEASFDGYQTEYVLKHHWVHRRRQDGKCSTCAKSFPKFNFYSKEIVSISCSWCKRAYHNKIACFTLKLFEQNCDMGSLCELIIPPWWIYKILPHYTNHIALQSDNHINKSSFKSNANEIHQSNNSISSVLETTPNSASTGIKGSGRNKRIVANRRSSHGIEQHKIIMRQANRNRRRSSSQLKRRLLQSSKPDYLENEEEYVVEGNNISHLKSENIKQETKPDNTDTLSGAKEQQKLKSSNDQTNNPHIPLINRRRGSKMQYNLPKRLSIRRSSHTSGRKYKRHSQFFQIHPCQKYIPQTSIQEILSAGATEDQKFNLQRMIDDYRECGRNPVVVLLNPKSGGNKGSKLIYKFHWLLNPRQVFDITKTKPETIFNLLQNISNLRVLVGGGDGTVGWIFGVLDKMLDQQILIENPAVSILPLGTGNDLSRYLGWGGSYNDESLNKILFATVHNPIKKLDRWNLSVTPFKPKSTDSLFRNTSSIFEILSPTSFDSNGIVGGSLLGVTNKKRTSDNLDDRTKVLQENPTAAAGLLYTAPLMLKARPPQTTQKLPIDTKKDNKLNSNNLHQMRYFERSRTNPTLLPSILQASNEDYDNSNPNKNRKNDEQFVFPQTPQSKTVKQGIEKNSSKDDSAVSTTTKTIFDISESNSNTVSVTSSIHQQPLTPPSKKELPINVFNNYFGLGCDAQVTLEFHTSREANPEKFNSRFRNKMFYAGVGGRDILKRSWKNLVHYIHLECDGIDLTERIKDMKFHSLLFLNISRYAGGTLPWGEAGPNEMGVCDILGPFEKPRSDDGFIEVIGFTAASLAALQVGGHGDRICQCRHVTLITKIDIPCQVDGEPVKLAPSVIRISHRNTANVIINRKKYFAQETASSISTIPSPAFYKGLEEYQPDPLSRRTGLKPKATENLAYQDKILKEHGHKVGTKPTHSISNTSLCKVENDGGGGGLISPTLPSVSEVEKQFKPDTAAKAPGKPPQFEPDIIPTNTTALSLLSTPDTLASPLLKTPSIESIDTAEGLHMAMPSRKSESPILTLEKEPDYKEKYPHNNHYMPQNAISLSPTIIEPNEYPLIPSSLPKTSDDLSIEIKPSVSQPDLENDDDISIENIDEFDKSPIHSAADVTPKKSDQNNKIAQSVVPLGGVLTESEIPIMIEKELLSSTLPQKIYSMTSTVTPSMDTVKNYGNVQNFVNITNSKLSNGNFYPIPTTAKLNGKKPALERLLFSSNHLSERNQNTAIKELEKEFLEAVKRNDITKVNSLIKHHKNIIMATDNTNSTCLHYAVQQGYKDLVKLILDRGNAHIIKNIINQQELKSGQTPLHMAAIGARRGICALLVENGASLTIQDFHGNTPYDLALVTEDYELAEYLKYYVSSDPTQSPRREIYNLETLV